MALRAKIILELQKQNTSQALIADVMAATEIELARFATSIDESEYSLGEWIEALHAFSSWEVEQQRTILLVSKIEYLNCCIQGGTQAGKLQPLVDVWQGYVDKFGVASSTR